MVQTVVCSECQHDIKLNPERKYIVGDILECSVCGTEFEIISIDKEGNIKIETIELEK